jgi:uncharacterized protein (TIGR03437 family)
MDVFSAIPGVFTLDGSGTGQAAVLNQDGSVNSSANPAAHGSVISVFMTGAGQMSPPQKDGYLAPITAPFPMTAGVVSCSLGQVVYAGAAPGLVAGAVQVNVLLSMNAPVGNQVPILMSVDFFTSGYSTTIAVR